jgi:hypothetical protein
MARRQRDVAPLDARPLLLRRFQSKRALLPRVEPRFPTRIDLMSAGRTPTMRWKISHHGHDVRQIDLLAMLVLVIVIIVAWRYLSAVPDPQNTAVFIEPSQSVRW